MNSHTLKILEYDRLKDILAKRAVSTGGQAAIMALQPLTDLDLIQRKLAETGELRVILDEAGEFPLYRLPDVTDALGRARAIGSILEIADFIGIGDMCRASRTVQSFLADHREKAPQLTLLNRDLHGFKALEEKIEATIDPAGGIYDHATPELQRIRRALQTKRDYVQQKLNEILHKLSDGGRKDAFITQREGRYVIPVRNEERGKIRGIVHDQSTSGATAFIEPLATVAINNEIRALEMDERKEINRILQNMTDMVREALDRLIVSYQTLIYLDVTCAKARLANDFACVLPLIGPDCELNLRDMRHLLLEDLQRRQNNASSVVRNSIHFPQDIRTILITGPNTGGKTVLVKTVGLIALMAQTGLPIPAAEGSSLPIFSQIFADIGDEQSLEQSLSTFSAHIKQIVHFVTEADRETLILLDELGSGTDPEEGAALSMGLLDHLTARRAHTLATTHHGSLKLYAHEHPHIANGSMEFDRATLTPTFRFHQNMPGSSYALEIAERLGMPPAILQNARGRRESGEHDIAKLIAHLEDEHRRLAAEREGLATAKAQQDRLVEKYQQKLEDLKTFRQEAREKALKEAADLIKNAKKAIKETIQEIKREQATKTVVEKAEKVVEQLHKTITSEQREIAPEKYEEPLVETLTEARVGDIVRLLDWNKDGTVMEVKDDERITVAAGALKITVPLNRLVRSPLAKPKAGPKVAPEPRPQTAVTFTPNTDAIKPELDLRGMTAEEAIPEVDKYLDNAYLASLERVRIIHGKGTGALRRKIGEHLPRHPRVLEFTLGDWNEGGSGVTVVKLKL